jgi:hypothetical protein
VEIGLLAFVGVLSAHWLAYFVSAPARLEREHLLASTGHGDWSLAGAIAIGALTAAFTSVAWGGLRRGGPRPSTTTIAMRLALLQTLGFLALEAAERAAAGGGALDALAEPVVALGVLVQVVVALVGALVTRLVVEVVERLAPGRAVDQKRAPRRAGFCDTRVSYVRRKRVDSGPGTLRGPPTRLPAA